MIVHNLTIAFRNMWKYKSQTLISIIGLAVGFTCFALATLWIRYEMTFDSFHKNAKQMYVVYRQDVYNPTGYSNKSFYPLSNHLKETFSEIANTTQLISAVRTGKVKVNDVEFSALTITADSSFLRMFDVKVLEGSLEFLIPGSKKHAITLEKAIELFGDENPIGKTINNSGRAEICAIVSGMSKRSNYAFDFIAPWGSYVITNLNQLWNVTFGDNTIIELLPGTNVESFEKKLYEYKTGEGRGNHSKFKIKPLTKIRYTDTDIERDVKFQHIMVFALSGLLVILCSVFNYLTIFISRFRIRQNELALRVVCGASESSLLVMLSVEFILTLLFAVALEFMLTQWLHKPFLALSDIQMDFLSIYRESLLYNISVILIALLAFWLIMFIFRRRSLNVSIRRSNKKLFRKTLVVIQLLISIGFAFCVIVILKQMYFLHNTNELGFSFHNRGSLVIYEKTDESSSINQLKQIPEITEIIDVGGLQHLIPYQSNGKYVSTWDDKAADMEYIFLETMVVSPEYIAFYDFQLLAGEMLTDSDPESMVLLNESSVRAFGWKDPIGKHFGEYLVKGVIKHVNNLAPTMPAKPYCYFKLVHENAIRRTGPYGNGRLVLFKYYKGTWETVMKKIEQQNVAAREIYNTEEEYNKYLKSENALLKLLSFVSAICILICVFGFVSLVSLTCEERRKEIAIRKINGATVGDILSIFAKEYFLLLMIGAIIAFSAGYFIMQRWLENYVKQTSIPAWIYLAIILALALVIVLCVGWQVYRASVENPAEVVKGS